MEGYQQTTATKRIFQLRKRIRVVSGGTGASKTISILIWLIDYAQSTKNEIITIVGESVPHLSLGAIRDFQNIMVAQGYWDDTRWLEGKRYVFETGSAIEFISFDKFGKAHGPRRDVLFLNEVIHLPYNIVDQLITRTRKVVWMDFNPSGEFWFHTEMWGKRDDIDFIGDGGNYPPLTYLDNEALDDVTRGEIESHKHNKVWWTVYGEGKLGVIQGRIYTDWLIIEEIPHEARLERYGIDFGYSNDPTAIVAIYKYNGGFILDEITYLKGLSNRQIADILINQPKALVIADSAEPKSIDEIKSYGISILGSQKGRGSVLQGIQYVQQQRISVTKRSLNIIREYRNYMWVTDKDGKIINEPDVGFEHCMDGIRYGMESLKPQENTVAPKQWNDKLWRIGL